MDDIYQRETQNRVLLHNLDCRLQRLEELHTNMYELMKQQWMAQSLSSKARLSPVLLRSSSCNDATMTRQQDYHQCLSCHAHRSLSNERASRLRPPSDAIAFSHIRTRRHFSSRPPVLLKRRSTIHRLNASSNTESHACRIQSNEYTSITDGTFLVQFMSISRHTSNEILVSDIDTSASEHRSFRPVLAKSMRTSTFDENSLFSNESNRDEIIPADIDEQTHHSIGEIVRKRARTTVPHAPLHRSRRPLASFNDTDRLSLLSSVHIDLSTSSLDLLPIVESKD
jgi:hypothetical protein